MTDVAIRKLHARRIWDSRGRPTVEAEVTLSDGTVARGIAPAGASRGTREAVDRRDGGKALGGFDVQGALASVREEIAPLLVGRDPFDQAGIDAAIIALDGTPTKQRAWWQRHRGSIARRAARRCRQPRPAALAPSGRRGGRDDSIAGNPDLRRRRPCRPTDRRPGFHGDRASRQEFCRSAGSHGRGL